MKYDEDDDEHTYLGLPGARVPYRRIVVDAVDAEHEAITIETAVAPERAGRGQMTVVEPVLVVAAGLRREQRHALTRRLARAKGPLLELLRLPGLRRETPAIAVASFAPRQAWQIAAVGPVAVYRFRNGELRTLTDVWAPTIIEGHRLVEAVLLEGRAMRGDVYLVVTQPAVDLRAVARLLSSESPAALAKRVCGPCIAVRVTERGT